MTSETKYQQKALGDVVTEDEYDSRACRGVDPEIFYPEPSKNFDASLNQVRIADKYCGQCAIRLDCLQNAKNNQETSGIHGGQLFGGKPGKTIRLELKLQTEIGPREI